MSMVLSSKAVSANTMATFNKLILFRLGFYLVPYVTTWDATEHFGCALDISLAQEIKTEIAGQRF